MISETRSIHRSLLEAARAGPVLADGGLGTELQRAGLEPGACGELWNVAHAARVREIHSRYAAAGCGVLLTNTCGAHPLALARHGARDRTTAINAAGAKLARAAGARWVLGALGSVAAFIPADDDVSPDEVRAGYFQQVDALVRAGVNGIILQTMSALDETALAIEAARAAGAAIVVASMAYEFTPSGLRTTAGATPEEAAEAMLRAGADVIGANCGTRLTIFDHVAIVRRYRTAAPGALIMMQANAGQPALVDGVLSYDATPSAFADTVRRLADVGAAIVGGCCGTTPAHLSAAARVL